MKFLERATLIIFSDIMLILSIVACVLIFGWIDFDVVSNIVHKALTTQLPSQIILACSMVFILLSLKCIFFSSSQKEEKFRNGILLENEEGKLMISQETLQNIIKSTVTGFEGVEDEYVSISLDKENSMIVNISINVKPKVVIKELSANIQTKVKEIIKNTIDIEVKTVNIKVRNVAPKPKEKMYKEA